ncbi:MAG: MBL fold metallo-hydrolase [Lachnospiraceae bacterium]|jgi:hydroxyacylglutathione hydrolase|nr:MBL fold metallo-hydrolase [Lachnospiraceae bacterium]
MYIRLDTGIYIVAGGKGGPGISHSKDGNVYLIEDSGEAALIDGGSGMDTDQIIENIGETGVGLMAIRTLFLTHAHGDHGGGVHDFQDKIQALTVVASEGEKRLLEEGTEEELGLIAAKKKGAYPKDYHYFHGKVDHVTEDEETYQIGNSRITAILLPGHSIESVCYLLEKNNKRYLFSGDSIYLEGRLSLINCYGSTMEGYRKNIHKLADQNIDALIPSHYRFTMSGGQNHINQAIEALEYSSLPPML